MNLDGTARRAFRDGNAQSDRARLSSDDREALGAVQERDRLGDDLTPDFVTEVKDGGFYGWPYAYAGPHPNPRRTERPEMVAKTIEPDVLIQAHSAVLRDDLLRRRDVPG